jgi:molybdate transport system substrate-binding protein
VIYPVAIMKKSAEQNAAQAFIKYLQSDEAMQIFTSVGFSKAK